MNLNKFTKAELISKINKENLLKDENKNQIKKESTKDTNNTSKFLEIFSLIKKLILSLTIIATLNKIFKIFKTVRAVLKLANYIILSIFGIFMLDAFGL